MIDVDSDDQTQSSAPVIVRVMLSKRKRNDQSQAFYKRWKLLQAKSDITEIGYVTSHVVLFDTALTSNASNIRSLLWRKHSSLLSTLYQREIGVLKSCIHLNVLKRKVIIPFSILDTPSHTAVIALDRSGSYIISLSDTVVSTSHVASLSLSFYANPSHYRMTQSCIGCTTLMIFSIPLTIEKDEEDTICCSQTPVKILMAADGQIGIALFAKSFLEEDDPDERQEEEVLGFMTLFLPPSQGRTLNGNGVYTRYSHVSLTRTMNSYTIRNLLWKTKLVPFRGEMKMEKHRLTRSVKMSSTAYAFFLDDEDNFIIHWIDFHSLHQVYNTYVLEDTDHNTSKAILCHDDPCMLPLSEETLCSEDKSTQEGTMTRPTVVYRASLRMSILVDDIISNRQTIFGSKIRHFKYAYSLICMNCDGRTVDAVLSFTNPSMIRTKKSDNHAYAVIVSIDIFSQTYKQIKWYQHSNCTKTKKLQKWCDEIALHKRMLDMYVGPYCVTENRKDCRSFQISTHENNVFNPRDCDPEIWSIDKPKSVEMSSLYPDCDVITNDAILKRAPVVEIKARDFPIHIQYC